MNRELRDGSGLWVSAETQCQAEPMRGSQCDGCLEFDSPSQLLADAVELWASGGGILVTGLPLRWIFEPGMLYGSTRKWWHATSERATPHEGLDFFSYLDGTSSEMRDIEIGTPVRPILPGVVCAIFDDFVASTVLISHDVADDSSLLHSENPEIRMKCWPTGQRLLSIYAHVDPPAGLAVGDEVKSPSIVIGVVAPWRTRPTASEAAASEAASQAAPGAAHPEEGPTPLDSASAARVLKIRAPSHLHFSVGWIDKSAVVPTSWADMLSHASFRFSEPPMPAGM